MSLSVRIERMKDAINILAGKPWMQYIWLLIFTLLAVVLRIYKLGAWSFWIDEIFTINHAKAHFSTPQLIFGNIPPARNWIPVSLLLTAQVFNLWGVSELHARIVSAIIGIISIPILYFPIKKMFDTKVALITTLLLAVAPWHIEWSQNARFYTMLLLFYTLALVVFFYAIEKDRPLFILAFFVLFYLALSERLISMFIIPVVLVYMFSLFIFPFEKPPGLKVKNVLLILLPIIIGVLIELLSRLFLDSSRFFGDFNWFFQYNLDDPIRLLSFIGFEIGVPLMGFSTFSGIYILKRKNRAEFLIFLSAIVPVLLLLGLNLFLFTKTRYIFITLPSWIILGAIGIREAFNAFNDRGKLLVLGLLIIFVTDAGSSNLLYYQVNNGNRLNWRKAFSIVEEQKQGNDEVVTWWPQWQSYYWDKEIISWETFELQNLEDNDKRFWFILDNEIIWGNIQMKNWLEQNAELVDVLYLRREDDAYLRIYFVDSSPGLNHTNITEESE